MVHLYRSGLFLCGVLRYSACHILMCACMCCVCVSYSGLVYVELPILGFSCCILAMAQSLPGATRTHSGALFWIVLGVHYMKRF